MEWMMLTTMIATIIPLILLCATLMMNKYMEFSREKSTPFECGFDPHNNSRTPFSLRFFLLAVLFLVFDIEIALLMPIPTMNWLSINTKMIIALFISVLLMGLYHEWNEGSLEWK